MNGIEIQPNQNPKADKSFASPRPIPSLFLNFLQKNISNQITEYPNTPPITEWIKLGKIDWFKFGSNDFKNPITIKLYVTWFGIIKCFRSTKKIIIKDIVSMKNNKVVVVNPNTKKTKRKEKAQIASTKKY